MDLNNFTIKSQDAIGKATEIAISKQNQSIEPSHLLKGILTVDEDVIPYLLKKLNVNLEVFSKELDKLIDCLPKVSSGQQYLSSNSNRALQKASELASEGKDEFISIEHMLLAILSLNDPAARLLHENGVKI
jgi:ATP-dependent Clp protease ATP-binding subunit ClpB